MGSVQRFTFGRRQASFLACTFGGLFCGTNYVFSSYAPQLSDRAHLTALEINLVGIAGNMGVYLLSPFTGKLVDTLGVKSPLAIAGACLFIGYYGIYTVYVREWQHAAAILCLFSALTGVGSSLGNSAVINASAKSFPHNRGTATAFPVAAFGLSAFVFSRINHGLFIGNTPAFLQTLAFACGISLIACSLVVGVYPPSGKVDEQRPFSHQSTGSADRRGRRKSDDDDVAERSSLLSRDDSDTYRDDAGDNEASLGIRQVRSGGSTPVPTVELTGIPLMQNWDFQLMITVVALLSGSGLMYINNVSNTLVALSRAESPASEDTMHPEALQQLNVSVLSIFNCAGRIFAGIVSDIVKARFGIQRSIFLVFSAILFVLLAAGIYTNTSSHAVVLYTSLMGFGYGQLFGIAPVLTSELFGLRHFSTNWGMMSIAPGISGNIFNLLFGHIYDTHSDPHTHICAQGINCYRSAFLFTGAASLAAAAFAIVLFRHHTKEWTRLR
ncbi:GTP-binding protein rbg1 [Savitreella phatthalungensis]